jgi:cellulose synthase/poly-beta-1,6-N-acetylglucosamine synthase-like glycosyltransferase/glycosyltransferase involved in cell wall biosynthesis
VVLLFVSMSELDIVIPVHNEQESIEELLRRIEGSLTSASIDYGIYVVDDYCDDNTAEIVKKYVSRGRNSGIIYDANGNKPKKSNSCRVELVKKLGKQGKAFSILEGFRKTEAEYIVMIDGDLQYPPEAIPQLYKLAKIYGVAVANRKERETSFIRTLASRTNRFLFEKLILGLNCDTQSGLKVFHREIIEKVSKNEVTGWTIDMPLLVKAGELGYKVASYDITFAERKGGRSKVRLVRDTFEIALGAIKLRLKGKEIFEIEPEDPKTPVGAGIAYGGKRFITHTDLARYESAFETFYGWQKVALIVVVALTLGGFVINPLLTVIIFLSVLTVIYLLDLAFGSYLLLRSLDFPPEIDIAVRELGKIDPSELPVYSILCPMYKEAEVLPNFVKAIDKLDWPEKKLEILLLLEEDDIKTIEKANSLDLPEHFKVVVVPHSYPKTKPKACNFGFSQATGEFVVIYDAEDRPEKDQLKKAYLAFNKLGSKIVCLQSKLNYYNGNQNLLTRLFTAEYSLWFDLILPGLQSIETAIPLGGTSNHFRRSALKFLSAWDPFNVTEDCDLGARLFKKGFRTAIINSTTFEEANSKVGSWIKQRSRWIKGYLQTFLVHMRDPIGFYRKEGLHAFIFQLIIGLRMAFILINPILWASTISFFLFKPLMGQILKSVYLTPFYYMAVFSLVFGNFVYFYNYMLGLAKRGQWHLMRYVYLVPFYWLLGSWAALKAFYQLVTNPYYWEKTQHGLYLPGLMATKKTGRSLVGIKISIETEFPSKVLKTPSYIFESLGRLVIEFFDLIKAIPNGGSEANLNILILNWRDTKHVWAGGAETYVHEIAKEWVKKGHSVTTFCGWDGVTKRDENVEGINIVRRGGFYTVYPLAFVYYLFKFRRHFDVVVDCENGIPFFTPFYVDAPKLLLIHHVHQDVHRNYLPFPLSEVAIYLESNVMPNLYRNLPIITVSESSKRDIFARNWGYEENVEVINPGVDLTKFARGKKSENPSFIYFGRLKNYKNVDIALKAFSQICREYPDAKLDIAGQGEAMSSLKHLAERLNISDKVVFHGRVDNETRKRLLSESWVSLQPSSYEGWGITVLEANASGTPVIASDVKGLRDSVRDGKTGLLVPVSDVDALSKAMLRMINNPSLRERLSENAYFWSQKYSWREAANRFDRAIEAVIRPKERYVGAYEFKDEIEIE